MSVKLVHISDIHYQRKQQENHDVVLRALLKDIKEQKELSPSDTFFSIFSGDIVHDADDQDSYNSFASVYGQALDMLGLHRSQRICVPGNHDVSQKRIKQSLLDHEGIVSQNLDETRVNDYLQNLNPVFREKFNTYREFEDKFSSLQAISTGVEGRGYKLNDKVGVYCLNSALFSSAGLLGADGEPLVDKGRLALGTRSLHEWIAKCDAPFKILVSHHPLDWMTDWAKREIRSLLISNKMLYLSGHTHDQEAYHMIEGDSIQLHAPPLFTTKADTLGYALITVCPIRQSVTEVIYRQWTKHQRFLPGVSFSGTPDGKLKIGTSGSALEPNNDSAMDVVEKYLSGELEDALKAFSVQPRVWVERIIADKPERDGNGGDANKISISSLINEPKDIIIQAPPQFGLTCLARYMALQAWRDKRFSRWAWVDARQVKSSENSIRRAVETEAQRTGHAPSDVQCIILDSWHASDRDAVRILKTLCDIYPKTPVFVMHTIDGQAPINPIDEQTVGRRFRTLHLWSLAREHMRSFVAGYNFERHIGDEDAVTSRVVSDIDTLNLHRTPLNCLTVLKASEADFDENPVNRTDVLHRVLFILFNIDSVPRYKVRPDMKDCEHVLGYLSETLIRENVYAFSRERFIQLLRRFCESQVIAVDIEVLFDMLYDSHILVSFGSDYTFKFTSWLYYFAAHRMHHDRDFATFILAEMRYVRFPEIIEFYTGVDRQRADAVKDLAKDLRAVVDVVKDKCGLPREFNPYALLEWQASSQGIEKMQAEMRDGVAASNLPDAIKDRYADRDYDQSRPYSQTVRDLLTGETMLSLMLCISASSRALRNSDYVDPALRKDLLEAIYAGWRQVTQVLLVILPPLAKHGHASFDGAGFVLTDDFGNDPVERFRQVLMAIPYNIVKWYQDSLYSPKMAPLLAQAMEQINDDVVLHEMVLLQIAKRPQGWKEQVERYIYSIHKRSYYLCDVYAKLREEYKYAFVNSRGLRDLEYLIKMVATKHVNGIKEPGPKAIKKVSDEVLPKRIAVPNEEANGSVLKNTN